ncbi:uncharacterized protein B0T23DRAFT_388291 [Neurospora hispaniola]|uniref:Uncharacterized protein n=1 Tax=Neurospora hispaniola TaxID=588809 RepID=A0AAJ0I177_9PEZI|nr:hypothetical protein B0T23DRAFT_388291 [Neurospora hispaniola]
MYNSMISRPLLPLDGVVFSLLLQLVFLMCMYHITECTWDVQFNRFPVVSVLKSPWGGLDETLNRAVSSLFSLVNQLGR